MAWGTGAIPADELTAKSRGYPLLVGNNILERSTTQAQWRTSNVWSSGSDATESGAPGRLAYDRRGKLQTRPTSASVSGTSISLLFDLDDSSAQVGEFDTVAIINHNFADIPNLTGVYVEISNVAAFTVGADTATICSWTSFPNAKRLVSTNLSDGANSNRRLNNIRYVRVKLDASPSVSVVPRIGEVIIGRRQQLTMKGQLPFPDRPLRSESVDLRSESGELTRHALFSGASDRTINFNLGGTLIGSLDSEDSFRNFQDQINYGQKSFLYVEDPSTVDTDRRAWLMMLDPPEFAFTQLGPYEEELTVSMVELPPFVVTET